MSAQVSRAAEEYGCGAALTERSRPITSTLPPACARQALANTTTVDVEGAAGAMDDQQREILFVRRPICHPGCTVALT
jgi:hypothetical protein